MVCAYGALSMAAEPGGGRRLPGGDSRAPARNGPPGGLVRGDAKFSPPAVRRERVPRPELVARLGHPEVELVLVAAPAGYGKTTLLAEWAAVDHRPVAWVTLDEADNDPALLLASLTVALAPIEPVDPSLVPSLGRAGPRPRAAIAHRFGRVLANRSQPLVLVLDDAHSLVDQDALDVLGVVVVDMPPGSVLALSGRAVPPLPFTRLRPRQGIVRLGSRELAFSPSEAQAMLASRGVELRPVGVDELVRRTEGWPAALYLASLSVEPQASSPAPTIPVPADDRLITEYLKDELLDRLPPDLGPFLLEASCLERLSGPLCDSALGRRGSADLLQALAESDGLVTALDDRGEWYRLHRLVAELFEVELASRDRERWRAIHAGASRFFEHRDTGAAFGHALRAGAVDRAEALVTDNFGQLARKGHQAAIRQWLGQFDAVELARRPMLSIIAAHCRFAAGDGPGAAHWCARSALLLGDGAAPERDGWTPPVALAILRALVGFGPLHVLAEDATFALSRVGTDPWRSTCHLLVGAAEFMGGQDASAAEQFEHGRRLAVDAPTVLAMCLAHEAVVSIEQGDWAAATAAARRGRSTLAEHDIEDAAHLFLVTAVSSLVEARAGRVAEARADHHRAVRAMTGFLHQFGWASLQSRVALAHASVLFGDRVGARTLLDEAEHALERVPDAPRVAEQIARVRGLSGDVIDVSDGGPSSLSSAERRVLQYLPTHLTLADIADRLYVSRNTVKTQAIAIYRKLDVSSRGAAVDVARSVGLLEEGAPTG